MNRRGFEEVLPHAFLNGGTSVNAIFGLILAGVGVVIAWHHPLAGLGASVIFIALIGLGLARFPFWLVIVPAALPIIDLAPWTGWLSFEEFDLLVLALASGAYLSHAFWCKDQPSKQCGGRLSLNAILLIVSFAVSVLVSVFRGFEDAGGFSFGWYQGYYEPMNSIRLAKSFFLALCLLPLWLRCYSTDHERTIDLFGLGMATGLSLASLATIWERLAFTGLLDFSTDYRTTALFWEMHVGGAALDGFLALTVPFAIWAYVDARSSKHMFFFGSILAMATYACMTSFSRGVYLAIPFGLAWMAGLSARNVASQGSGISRAGNVRLAILMVSLFGGAAYWIFPTSGYRGMLALCITVALLYPVSLSWGQAQAKNSALALFTGAVVAAIGTVVGNFLPKGAYLVFALGATLTATALWLGRERVRFPFLVMTLAGYLLALAGCVSIALHWGGEQAFESMSLVCLFLLVATIASRNQTLPERSGRWHISVVGAMLIVGFLVATFSGGAYMTERFSNTGRDFESRLQHWESGLAQLNTLDWLLGKGLGRYPAGYLFTESGNEHPGGYRHVESKHENYLLLSGGQHVNGWGEMFRVTQRVTSGTGPYKVQFDVQTDKDVGLHFEICEKHLLYNAACVTNEIVVKGAADAWQKLELNLKNGSQPGRGLWFAPNMIAFSVSVASLGRLVKLDNLDLHDGFGANLLANGDFSDGLAHWFSSSDKYHLPWHMKSLFLHVLFDQGSLGLSILSLMILAAFWRLTVGVGRRHPLAPPLVASLAGFLVVGLFDSLLDVPRLATLFYLLLMIALTIKVESGQRSTSSEFGRLDISSKGI